MLLLNTTFSKNDGKTSHTNLPAQPYRKRAHHGSQLLRFLSISADIQTLA